MRIERMKRWVIMMLLCGLCYTKAFAYLYDQNAFSKNWGYQPVVHNTAVAAPAYQFRTTSAFISTMGESRYNSLLQNGNRPGRVYMTEGWPTEDNPIGEVDDPAPIGDTPWWLMLLFAAGYVAIRMLRERKKVR